MINHIFQQFLYFHYLKHLTNIQSVALNSTTGNSTNPLNSAISSGHTPLTPYVKSNP